MHMETVHRHTDYAIIRRFESLKSSLNSLGCQVKDTVNCWAVYKDDIFIANCTSLDYLEGIYSALASIPQK
jgi:hypothetical protein